MTDQEKAAMFDWLASQTSYLELIGASKNGPNPVAHRLGPHNGVWPAIGYDGEPEATLADWCREEMAKDKAAQTQRTGEPTCTES